MLSTVTVAPSDAEACAWCDFTKDTPIDKHRDWCEVKLAAQIIDKGKSKNLKFKTLPDLETKIKDLMKQIADYESVLSLIAAPVRPDGTYNRDRNACGMLATNVLKAYGVN